MDFIPIIWDGTRTGNNLLTLSTTLALEKVQSLALGVNCRRWNLDYPIYSIQTHIIPGFKLCR